MLAGRFCSVGINFLVQVLIVRAIAKSEYGAFAYAMSVMGIGSSLAVMGLGKSLERFAPMYQEQRDYRRAVGTILLITAAVVLSGIGVMCLVWALDYWDVPVLSRNSVAAQLTVIIAILIPFEGVNHILEKMFAVFARPRALFVRRYIVGPGLKITAVIFVLVSQSSVYALAYSYVCMAIVETLYSVVVLYGVFRETGLLPFFRWSETKWNAREIFAYSAPLALSDLMPAIRAALVTMVVEFFHGALAVAAFRAVLPVARLNHVALESFRLLFTPTIARLHAQGDRGAIEHAYWLSSSWIAVVTFPLFAFCVIAPDYLSTWLFGAEYSSSAQILAVLAIGFYVSAVLGFARQVLPIFGWVGKIFWNDLFTALLSVGLTLALVPRWGEMGGAIAASAALIVGVVMQQISLSRLGLIRGIDRQSMVLFAVIVAGTLVPVMIRLQFAPGLPGVLGMIIGASLAVVLTSYSLLDIQATFPEIQKLMFLVRWMPWFRRRVLPPDVIVTDSRRVEAGVKR